MTPLTYQIQTAQRVLINFGGPQFENPPPTTSLRGEKSRKAATHIEFFFFNFGGCAISHQPDETAPAKFEVGGQIVSNKLELRNPPTYWLFP